MSNNLNVSDVRTTENPDLWGMAQIRALKLLSKNQKESKELIEDEEWIALYDLTKEKERNKSQILDIIDNDIDKEKIIELFIKETQKIYDVLLVNDKQPMRMKTENTKDTLGEQDTEDNVQYKTFFEHEKKLYAQIYREHAMFAEYDPKTDTWDEVEHVLTSECAIRPVQGKELETGTVLLPSELEDYGDVETLRQEIEGVINEFVSIDSDFAHILSIYTLMTHVYDQLEIMPYVNARGDIECGKSRLIRATGGMCYIPMRLDAGSTSATIFRRIEKWQGTPVMDEMDLAKSSDDIMKMKILLTGNEKGGYVQRCDKENNYEPMDYSTFCPKLFTTRRPSPDSALESRSLNVVMSYKPKHQKPKTLGADYRKKRQKVVNKLALFKLRHHNKIKTTDVFDNDNLELRPRMAQMAESFSWMVTILPKSKPVIEKYLKEQNKDQIMFRELSLEGQIISILRTFNKGPEEAIRVKEISDELNAENGQNYTTAMEVAGVLNTLQIPRKKTTIEGISGHWIKKKDCQTRLSSI